MAYCNGGLVAGMQELYSAGGNSGPRRTLTKKEKDNFFLKAQNP